ncbi:MAG: hypothetical protein IT392_04355 [Nitrospirae bacterium]|nr:hypothetical protein [Nitrospirota bacterium]
MAKHYLRFTLFQRILHVLLFTSVLGLVTTGMPLFFNQSGWAFWIAHTMGGFGVMGFFHRLFGTTMLSVFTVHMVLILRRVVIGREYRLLWGPDSMVPQPKDFVQLFQNIRYFIGLGPAPRFDRFTYWEKFDYWAVVWGMGIIGGTGLILWFHDFFSRIFPGWFFNVAILVHGEEALLASGFLFAVHFFNTHIRPEKFPIDLVIFTGRVSGHEMIEERPEQYQRLVREGKLEKFETTPPPMWLKNLGRIVGAIAVTIGLTLFVLILYAFLRA